MADTRLGVNITADDINDFFTLNPNRATNTQHKVKKPTFKIHDPAARQQQLNAGKTPLERRSSDSKDLYHIVSEPDHSEQDFSEAFLQPDVADDVGLNDIEQTIPAPKPPDHPAFDVYDNYKFDHTYDTSLPITEHREWVVGTIESNQVTIIQGATGSGKTTQVPQYVLDYHYERRQYCNILVTQPRRIAAQSLAKRVSQERNWPVGHVVGYQVARDRKVSEDTRVTYMTTGVLIQKLIKSRNMDEYTHIILDEIHERDQNIDLVMLIVKKFLRTVSRHTKVILMSATMDCSLFSQYFAIQIQGKLERAPVVSVEGKMFDVSLFYLDNLTSLGEIPQQSLVSPEIAVQTYQLARALIVEFDGTEASMQGLEAGKKFLNDRGTVLVFLPGYPEIDAMHKSLESIELDHNLQILILHSQITSQDQSKIFMKAQPGKRKIILSTNIAESSITVPDIKYVIDFCLVKNLETDRDTNYTCLRMAWAPISSLEQRKGRAGRVSNGECFRMVTREFEGHFAAYGTPEMQRCPLSQVVLHVKSLDIGDPCSVLKMALQPPDKSDIRRTILYLKEVGALTLKQNDRINPLDGDLTFVGKVLAALPVDIRIGKLIILGHVFGCLEECLIMGAALSLKSIFARPFKRDWDAYSHKMEWSRASFSDCIASLHAFREWKGMKTNFGFGRHGEKEWGRKHFVETKMINEIDQLVSELETRLKSFNIRCPQRARAYERRQLSQDDILILKVVICGAFYPFYFFSGEIDDKEAMKTMSGHDPNSTVILHNVPTSGVMYKSRIAALVRSCGRGKYLHFESSRCYVEFEKLPNQNTQNQMAVLPGVYLAIKMRQLRMPLELIVSQKRDAELRQRFERLRMSDASNPFLRADRLTASLEPEGGVRNTNKQLAKPVELKTKGYIQIHVSSVVEAGHFWGHYGTPETFAELENLQNDINVMGGTNLTMIPHGIALNPNEFVLAYFDDGFYRAKIIDVEMVDKNEVIEVFFMDYGNTSKVLREHLRRCPEAFLLYPFQAFECFLCGIRPIHGEWSEDANHVFHNMAQDKILLAKVYSIVRGTMRLDLYDNDEHINAQLIKAGFAQQREESRASQIAREDSQRLEHAITESEALLKEFDESASNYDIEEYDAKKIKLRGPSSPYEMQFYNLTYNGKFRATNIDKDSVNSVFMCEEPQDKHPILMVSANVGVNASGNTLIARETTVMPNIHGISSLIPVLFAPFAEYRWDKSHSKYIGALCGLGYVEQTGAAIMPEHDIEVTFNVEFTIIDVALVNTVRQCINLALSDEHEWNDAYIEKIQRSARKRTKELLYAQRQDVEPTTFPRPYTWNEIPAVSLLELEDDKTKKAKNEAPSLYTLHCGLLIESPPDATQSRTNNKQEAVRRLYEMAGRSTEVFPNEVVCPLCDVRCRHPRALRLHLESRLHRSEESVLYQRAGR